MSAPATRGQIRAIHAEKRRNRLDDDAYRLALAGYGVGSSKELSRDAAARFIDVLKGGPSPASPLSRPSADAEGHPLPQGERALARGALRLDGPYAGVCRALWLSAWNLGLVRDRTDRALSAFVERQTGLSLVNWVRDPRDGAKAIEGLKGWIARDAGVAWPTEAEARRARHTLSRARKLAVIKAQRRRLGAPEVDPTGLKDWELDEAISAFGRAIRATKSAEQEEE